MTTNAGAQEMSKAAIGFGRERREGEDQEAINRMFTPEFRNRLDQIIAFSNLPPDVVAQVVGQVRDAAGGSAGRPACRIDLSDDARKWLAQKGFDPLYGARPLARVIQENIKKALAEDILFGKLGEGRHGPHRPR
jgi:ATP-dependent Clp protease ATP-binding subunit ClpA